MAVLAALFVPTCFPVLGLTALTTVGDEVAAGTSEEGRARGAAVVARRHGRFFNDAVPTCAGQRTCDIMRPSVIAAETDSIMQAGLRT